MTTLALRADYDVPDLLGTSPADLIDQTADQPTATPNTARQRAERIRTGLVSYTRMRQDIADAYACHDWIPLGHSTWFEYVEREFGDELRTLGRDRDERREAVRDLRGQGLSMRQIASATGVAQSTVRDDLQVSGVHSPETVTGTDGKTYPAQRPPKESTDSPAGPAAPAHDPRAEPVLGDSRPQDRPGEATDPKPEVCEPVVITATVIEAPPDIEAAFALRAALPRVEPETPAQATARVDLETALRLYIEAFGWGS